MQDPKSLVGRVGALAGDLLQMAQTRLEMLGVELQMERDSLLARLRLGMVSAVAATLAGVGAMHWLDGVLPPARRGTVFAVVTLLWIAVALTAMLLARGGDRRVRQPLFSGVVAQLARDRAMLSPPAVNLTLEASHEPPGHTRTAA